MSFWVGALSSPHVIPSEPVRAREESLLRGKSKPGQLQRKNINNDENNDLFGWSFLVAPDQSLRFLVAKDLMLFHPLLTRNDTGWRRMTELAIIHHGMSS
jgi:hypothetical protein